MYSISLAAGLLLLLMSSFTASLMQISPVSRSAWAIVVRKDPIQCRRHPWKANLSAKTNDNENNKNVVALGSEEYYKGFVSRSLEEEPAERISGEALLGPTFKFVGGFAILIGVLFLGFMASNGLL